MSSQQELVSELERVRCVTDRVCCRSYPFWLWLRRWSWATLPGSFSGPSPGCRRRAPASLRIWPLWAGRSATAPVNRLYLSPPPCNNNVSAPQLVNGSRTNRDRDRDAITEVLTKKIKTSKQEKSHWHLFIQWLGNVTYNINSSLFSSL